MAASDRNKMRQAASPAGERKRGVPLRLALAAGALAVLVVLGFGLAWTEMGGSLDPEALGDRIKALDEWGQIAVVLLMVVHSFVPFPAEILALCAGAVYGTVQGTALVWTGAMAGAALSFGLSRWLGQPFVHAMLGPRGRARLERWSAGQGAVTLLTARFIPVIAFNLINYAAGLTRVGWGTFLWTTGVGILPLTALMVWMGAHMVTLTWPALLAVSAAGIVLVLGGHWWARRNGWLGDDTGPGGPV
jgi:uncharacterized membrane protein YdjX (TVP38/TMEM64 family)